MGLVLAVDITVGISDVDLTKLGEEIDAGAVGLPEFRMTALPIADIAKEHWATKIIGGVLQRLQERSMARRHVVPHLLQIKGQRVWGMGDS